LEKFIKILYVALALLLLLLLLAHWSIPTHSAPLPEPTPVVEIQEPLSLYTVAPIPLTPEDRLLLAKNIYFEAGVEDYKGKIAVAQVTYNRLKSGKWGRRLDDVVYAKNQFSWTLYKAKRYKVPKGDIWNECLQVAWDFQNGVRIRDFKDVTHYHAEYVNPHWADEDSKVAQIGTHIFYSL
jgi:spore germination cell wall hydrolase CwlJ-like protein